MIPIYVPRIKTDSAKDALESNWISSQGPYLEKTRTALSTLFNIPYIILMNNGTSATHMLLKALKFKHPDIKRIYAPNNVFVAVWNTILYEYDCDAMTILEMDPITLNMRTDEEYIRSLEPNSAVMIVHNIGNIVNVPHLKRMRPDIIFIEDNCEGLFGKYEDCYSGMSPSSLCSAVSFFANKTITCGEGGAFFTHDKEVYDFIHCSINHGASAERYVYKTLGYNYRITNIQAALLYDQLTLVDSIRTDKHAVFVEYKKRLTGHVIIPVSEENTIPSEWMFVCGATIDYKQLESYMKNNGVDIRPFFYNITAHSHLANIHCESIPLKYSYFMLPSSPDLSTEQITHVCNTLIDFLIKNQKTPE
jgi:perosamine synthetase